MSSFEKHSEVSTAFDDNNIFSHDYDKLSKSEVLHKSLNSLSPKNLTDYDKPKSLEDSHFSYTVKK